ncbi:MAG: BLUF domain-containing protein [Methyloceanibacter sp.]
MQLVYASQPFGYDDLSLTGILFRARKNNEENGITGALICREDLFIQMLEGPRDKVTETFARIERDERHVNVTELFCREINQRLFPEWSMRHDPVQSWMWTPDEVARCGHRMRLPEALSRTPERAKLLGSSRDLRSNLPRACDQR